MTRGIRILLLYFCTFVPFHFLSPAWGASIRTPVQTDNFADNNLGSGTVTWTQINNCCSHIQNTSGTASSAHSSESVVQADGTYSADQYAKFKIITLPSVSQANGGIGVIVRSSGQQDSARDYYKYWVDGAGNPLATKLTKVINGTPTDLDSTTSVSWSVNDTIEIEVEGTTIRGYQNGTLRTTITDAALATGKAGLVIGNNVGVGDDWEGGDVTAGATTPIRHRVTNQ